MMDTSTRSKTSFIMPDENVIITPNWIADINLQYITIDRSGAVFASNKLKMMSFNTPVDLVVPNEINGTKVTAIGNYAFQSCQALRTVTIPEGVIHIGSRGFQLCTSLASINIPSTTSTISLDTFMECPKLYNINIDKPKNSISNSPWSAQFATVNWLG